MQTSVGEDVERLKCSYIASRNLKYTAILENSLVVSQKVKHRLTTWDSISTAVVISKGNKSMSTQSFVHKCLYQHYSQQPNKWKPATCSSLDEPINKKGPAMQLTLLSHEEEWSPNGHYMAEPWRHYPKWKKSEITCIIWFHLFEMSKNIQSQRDSRLVASRDWGKETSRPV
jgi:hypothetical protein